jgi:hypothetical protein
MKIYEHNVETGETFERNATAQEIEQFELDATEKAEHQTEVEAKAQAKAALLERLGITEDEAKLLLA